MNYLCLYTIDDDLADAFRLFYEGKYLIRRISEHDELEAHLRSPECKCQALIYDSGNPRAEDFYFLDNIKQKFPKMKVIISYVYFEEKIFSETLLASHVDAILYKPFDFGEVDRRLQQLLRNGSVEGQSNIPPLPEQSVPHNS